MQHELYGYDGYDRDDTEKLQAQMNGIPPFELYVFPDLLRAIEKLDDPENTSKHRMIVKILREYVENHSTTDA